MRKVFRISLLLIVVLATGATAAMSQAPKTERKVGVAETDVAKIKSAM